jgi:cell division protein FtsB
VRSCGALASSSAVRGREENGRPSRTACGGFQPFLYSYGAELLAQVSSPNYTNGMKIAAIIGLSLVLIFLGVNIYSFVKQENALGNNLSDVQARLTKAQADEANLQAEKQYLANPANLEKELRARFNYKNPGEKMIIIVPLGVTSTNATSVSD